MEPYAQDLCDDELFRLLSEAKKGQIRLGFSFEIIDEIDIRISGKIR
jgi:hypothetical protein